MSCEKDGIGKEGRKKKNFFFFSPGFFNLFMDALLPLITSPKGGGEWFGFNIPHTMSAALDMRLMLEKWYLAMRPAWHSVALFTKVTLQFM